MNKFLTLLVALVALFNGASAFTVARPMTTSRPVAMAQSKALTPRQAVLVDPAIAALADVPPLGSIAILFAMVSIWELITPGRAKKA
jgi:hypothetical protein